jgi:hypothetical protein
MKTPSFDKTTQLPMGKQLLLLDGQQRITSLASILEGASIRIKEGTKIKEKFIDIYFNIDHPEESEVLKEEIPHYEVGDLVDAKWEDGEFYPGKINRVSGKQYYIIYDDGDEGWTDEVKDLSVESKKELYFQIKNKKIENKPNWISVTKLFKNGVGSVLRELKIGANSSNFDKYNQRLNQLYSRKESYLYPVQIIRNKTYKEVTDIFIRVNSSGTRLRSSDLALAQITSVWPGSMKLFEEFVDKCVEKDFYLDENFFVRCLVCIATNQATFDNISQIPQKELKQAWELTKKGVRNTLNFVKNNGLIDSSALLPSSILLVPLVYHSCKNDLCIKSEGEKGFLFWFYNAAIWGRYSASTETRLTEDLITFKHKKPWAALIDNVWKLVGPDRKITPDDFRGKGVNSPLFFMMYVLARKNQARDLETGDIINYNNFGKNNEIEYDHLFPKSKLEAFLKTIMDSTERKKIINEISNIAFMTKTGNIIKSNEDPTSYFPKVYKKFGGEDYFTRQQIPYDLNLLSYDKYQQFLDKRAKTLTEKINEFLDSLK